MTVKIEPDVELETTIDSFDSVVLLTDSFPNRTPCSTTPVTGIAFVDNAHIKSEIWYKPLRSRSSFGVDSADWGEEYDAIEALIGICRERIASPPGRLHADRPGRRHEGARSAR